MHMVSFRTKFPARIRELPFSWRIFFSETTSIEIKVITKGRALSFYVRKIKVNFLQLRRSANDQ